MMQTADAAAFRLSRIYAQGWNTARTAKGTERANPYPADPERGRWRAGFADAETSVRKNPMKRRHVPLPLAAPACCAHAGSAGITQAATGNPARVMAPCR
jgi:hypothetical protein